MQTPPLPVSPKFKSNFLSGSERSTRLSFPQVRSLPAPALWIDRWPYLPGAVTSPGGGHSHPSQTQAGKQPREERLRLSGGHPTIASVSLLGNAFLWERSYSLMPAPHPPHLTMSRLFDLVAADREWAPFPLGTLLLIVWNLTTSVTCIKSWSLELT